MKRYFMIALTGILVFAVALVAYGAWLNHAGENVIAERMGNRVLPLRGERAHIHRLQAVMTQDMVNLAPEQMTDAVTRVEGVITEAYVAPHTHVHKGQPICRIVNEDIPLKILQVDSNIAKAEAEKKRSGNMYARHQALLAQDATSVEKVEEAEAGYKAACAAIDELQAQREQLLVMQGRQTIVSPIDGEVLMMYRRAGSFVQAGTAIALVGDFSRLRFSAAMSDEMLRSLLPMDSEREITFSAADFTKVYNTRYGAGNEGQGQHFSVRITDIQPALSEAASMRNVVWSIDNASGVLEAQSYSGVRITEMQPHQVLAVPLDAMIDRQRDAVFVLTDDGRIERQAIRTGAQDADYVEVLSGLREGEIVVTSGAEGLEDGMRATVELDTDDCVPSADGGQTAADGAKGDGTDGRK